MSMYVERPSDQTLERADAVMATIESTSMVDVDRFAFHLLRARALAGKNDPSSESDFRSAASTLFQRGHAAAWEILSECGRELARMGNLASGLRVFEEAIFSSARPPAAFRLHAAELFLEACNYEQAEVLASSLEKEVLRANSATIAERFRVERVLAACAIARGRILDAEKRVGDLATTSSDQLQIVQSKELRAMFASAAYDFEIAIPLLREVVHAYSSAGERDTAARALARAVQVIKEVKGDWAEARMLVERSSDLTSDVLVIERAHLRYLAGEEIGDSNEQGAELRTAIIKLLSSDERNSDRDLLLTIARHLETVEPPSSRQEYLHFFRWLPRLDDVADLEQEFRRLVPTPNPGDADFFPRVFGSIEVLRCLRADSVAALLNQAFDQVDARVFVYERLIDAAQRLKSDLPPVDVVLENCGRMKAHGLNAATRIRLQSVLGEREDQQAEQASMVPDTELPAALLGTQFEALHYANLSRRFASNTGEEAKAYARSAAAILQILGREAEGRRLLAQAEAGPLERRKADSHRVVVPLKAAPNPFQINLSSQSVSFEEAHALLEEPKRVKRMLREALPRETDGSSVVEFAIDGASEVGLPWEWVISQNQMCFRSLKTMPRAGLYPFFQIFWPRLPGALRRFFAMVWPLRVAILRPSVIHQERMQRGAEYYSRRSLREIYRAHSAKVFEPSTSTIEGIGRVFRDHDPQLIHIQAPVVDRLGQLGIDLTLEAAAEGGSSALDVDSTLLDVDFWTSQFRRSSREPVVILDPPRPPSEIEVARQLMLRNRFAADLTGKGKARAVLCVGLFPPGVAELAAERLALEIAGNPQFQQLLMLIRNGLPADRFCTEGATLYVQDPEALLK
jgi:hypothetical protein